MRIDELLPGQGGMIESVGGKGELRDRLLDMGLTPGTYVLLRKAAPLGDPIQLSLRGYELTIRKLDASRIAVRLAEDIFAAGSGVCSVCGGCAGAD